MFPKDERFNVLFDANPLETYSAVGCVKLINLRIFGKRKCKLTSASASRVFLIQDLFLKAISPRSLKRKWQLALLSIQRSNSLDSLYSNGHTLFKKSTFNVQTAIT